jgi:hypothetical protein
MHCMTVSLAPGGEGVGAMWGEEKTRESAKDLDTVYSSDLLIT